MQLKALTPAPAPWTYYPQQNSVGDASGLLVCRLVIFSPIDGELIASAPELAERVKALELQVSEARNALEQIRDRFMDVLKVRGMGAFNYVDGGRMKDIAVDALKQLGKIEKRVGPCPMNCAERWPGWGHAVECPTRKCEKHGLIVCDECASKLRG